MAVEPQTCRSFRLCSQTMGLPIYDEALWKRCSSTSENCAIKRADTVTLMQGRIVAN